MHKLRLNYSNYFYVGFSSLYINHRGLNRFHRGHTAYIPYMSKNMVFEPFLITIKN